MNDHEPKDRRDDTGRAADAAARAAGRTRPGSDAGDASARPVTQRPPAAEGAFDTEPLPPEDQSGG
ncbi:hypothetical protein WG922_18440 [Ramlibacter sp. AN1015]|uniref:hypothetical protein n=1 Tax=Ramlibacter sp. AN1015 TaxID=3133428 RepID=UPI0030BDCB38